MMMDEKEAAAFLGVSLSMMRKLRRDWSLRFYRIGRKVLYDQAYIRRWLKDHQVKVCKLCWVAAMIVTLAGLGACGPTWGRPMESVDVFSVPGATAGGVGPVAEFSDIAGAMGAPPIGTAESLVTPGVLMNPETVIPGGTTTGLGGAPTAGGGAVGVREILNAIKGLGPLAGLFTGSLPTGAIDRRPADIMGGAGETMSPDVQQAMEALLGEGGSILTRPSERRLGIL